MKQNREADSSLAMKRSTVLRLKSMKIRLGYASLEKVIIAFLDLRDAFGWDAIDISTLTRYKCFPTIQEGSARNDKEIYSQLGLTNAKKTSESFVIEPVRIKADIGYNFAEKGPTIEGEIKKPEKKKEGNK